MVRFGFGIMLLMSVITVACGRQVTPNPPGLGPGGTPPGYFAVFMNVAQPFSFTNYQYMIVLNTTGDRRTPSTDTIQTNWDGYSYDLVARGNGVSSLAQAIQLVRSSQNPHIPPQPLPLGTTPQTFSYNLNANGGGTEFQILAQKRIFVSPSPSPSPSSTPSNLWTFNAFVTQANSAGQWLFVDSMGAGGPSDPQFSSPVLCMTEPFDNTYNSRGFVPPEPAAEITSVEIANNPASPAPC